MMHSATGPSSSTISASSTGTPSNSSSTTTSNLEQYHYPPISTLRRPSRPSNIDLSLFDVNNTQHNNDPGIYSAPICHLKQLNTTNHHHHHHHQSSSLLLSSHPQTATFHYQAPLPPQQQQQQQQQQHVQLPSHYHHSHAHNMHSYQQQAHHSPQPPQQQQQHLLDPYSQHQHTPHTFPLQASSNHYHHYFHFPPSTQNLGTTSNSTPPAYNPLGASQQQLTLQANVTSNGHHSPLNHRSNAITSSTNNSSQPSTPTHNNRLLAVQLQEQQQQWSNPVLSPLMVKRLNEGNVVTSMHMDDDEDPSASIDALVADVDSGSHDLLDDRQNKSVDESKTTSTTPLTESRTSNTSPSPNLYLRGASHILTTPPNPLASNDHPDNQLTVASNFQKTFSPIHSAGFELTNNTGVPLTSSARASFFTFDTNVLEQHDLKPRRNENAKIESKDDSQDAMGKSMLINTDERTNGLGHDDNSSHSSTNSSSQTASIRNLSQILHNSADNKRLSSSSSPRSNDAKVSPAGSSHHHHHHQKSSMSTSSLSPQHQTNRHFCSHPDCNKIFANKSALAKHKLTHCQDRKHKCAKCNKGFKRLDHLHGHMLTHEEEKPHKCRVPDCNRTYCDARSLKRHIENAHQNILAAIHEGVHEEYRTFLPETAFVKTKDLSTDFSIDSTESNSPRSTSMDNEQVTHLSQQIRSSNGGKLQPTFTFDEEKSIECQICKKSFKNGAALNGHMRLHGGFNDKQQLPPGADPAPKTKRLTSGDRRSAGSAKRKRPNSPSSSSEINQRPLLQRSMPIKSEEEDIMMLASPAMHTMVNHPYSQQIYQSLPPCSDVLQHRFPDRSSSRTRSISSSVIPPQTNQLIHPAIKNPLSVQPTSANTMSKQSRKPLASHLYDRNNNHRYPFGSHINEDPLAHTPANMNNLLNLQNGLLCFDHLANPQMFPNLSTIHYHDEKMRKTLSADEAMKYYHADRQINGFSPSKHPQHYPYFRSNSSQPQHHHPASFSQFSVPSPPSATLTPNMFQRMFRHTSEMSQKDFYQGRPEHLHAHHPSLDEPSRYSPATSPYGSSFYHSPSPRMVHSPVPNSNVSVINTPSTSPYSAFNASRTSPPSSSSDLCNNPSQHYSAPPIAAKVQPSPTMARSSPSIAAPKKRILSAMKLEAQDEQQQQQNRLDEASKQSLFIVDSSPAVNSMSIDSNADLDKPSPANVDSTQESYSTNAPTLRVIPDTNSPASDVSKKTASGFLITTPSSSTGTNSSKSTSSSSSSHKHFNYENLPATIPMKQPEPNSASSFLWPSQNSQFRRQLSLNPGSQTPIPLPSTPYTPPPMLSPFRKGPGLYYQVFSQNTPQLATPAAQSAVAATTPVPPFTPVGDDVSGPKINIGSEYQALIPKLRATVDDDETDDRDELLFSSSQLPYLDEYALDKYEQLSRTNPLLFSPRHSPTLYPIELVYMLLHEYDGDLQRTLAALLDGTAHDIKQCRPLHRYHFPECDTWTNEEIDAFTKAMESSEKNFQQISQAIGTKSVKQCIEFYYMPKVNLNARSVVSGTASTALAAKRKRLQMIKSKQQKQIRDQYEDDTSSSSLNDCRWEDDNLLMSNDGSAPTHFTCDIDDCSQTFTSERAYRAHRRVKTHQASSGTVKRSRNTDSNN